MFTHFLQFFSSLFKKIKLFAHFMWAILTVLVMKLLLISCYKCCRCHVHQIVKTEQLGYDYSISRSIAIYTCIAFLNHHSPYSRQKKGNELISRRSDNETVCIAEEHLQMCTQNAVPFETVRSNLREIYVSSFTSFPIKNIKWCLKTNRNKILSRYDILKLIIYTNFQVKKELTVC